MGAMIEVEGLGKRYRLGGLDRRYRLLREEIVRAVRRPFGGGAAGADDHFWALKDVSFTVAEGEVLGIIGLNGAGKSTLLKILSRISLPTEGRARLYGRVGSLLEVGTGFHLELTGRDNIYLSGAILGMRRAEIRSKFDEIVDFAGISKFIDTPVKHYSSGMFVRLGFAVAAHLEPEIMLVDEVLAVGDVGFQRKCLGKMGDVARSGRTILFISHNMAAVSSLCPRCLWLEDGAVKTCDTTEKVVAAYLAEHVRSGAEKVWSEPPGNEAVRLMAARILSSAGDVAASLDWRLPFTVEIEYDLLAPTSGLQVGFWLHSADGTVVLVNGDREDPEWLGRVREPGRYVSRCRVPGEWLNSGHYTLTIASDVNNMELVFVEKHAIGFRIEQTALPAHSAARPDGLICTSLPWVIVRE